MDDSITFFRFDITSASHLKINGSIKKCDTYSVVQIVLASLLSGQMEKMNRQLKKAGIIHISCSNQQRK